ncbi:MAG: sodium:alanine symporter family protein [Ruminococcus sp.]|nr:sodium:alanine symporter family protein [Ruminococcus sp.]
MYKFLQSINSFVWGNGLIFILLCTGLIFTFKLKGIQFRFISVLIKSSKKREHQSNGLSQLKTACLSLGAAMGTGNIVGVASAISIGGAGAVFWMWVSALLGMALIYAENVLSAVYSTDDAKGPMAYLKYGVKSNITAVLFAAMCLGASIGMGGMVQVKSCFDSIEKICPVNRYYSAFVIFCVICFITKGGAKRIGNSAQVLLPIASVLYILSCFAVIFCSREKLPAVIQSIFLEALDFKSVSGGAAGTALSIGIRRGIFSNEAGLGSSPILHSTAESKYPELQGACAMTEVFIDTIICCTLTAVTILCAAPDYAIDTALHSLLGSSTSLFLAFEMSVFAVCTVIGWYYCGETAFKFISNKQKCRYFFIIYSAIVSFSAVLSFDTVWVISDIFNGLMIIPNVFALILLSKDVKKV